MTTTMMKAAVRRFLDGINQRELGVIDAQFAPDYQHHDPALPPEVCNGAENYKRHFEMYYAAFPDLRITIEDQIAEGDRVATRWRLTGTQTGSLMGMPPTGREVNVTALMLHRFDGERIAEGWVNFDALGMMRQLGAGST